MPFKIAVAPFQEAGVVTPKVAAGNRRVADIAMGSGHFLVAAVDHIEQGFTQYLAKRPLSGVQRFEAAYQRYCWPVASLADIKLAPFHILAAERGVYVSRDHHWHMNLIRRLCDAGAPPLHATAMIDVDTADGASIAAATAWWDQLTAAGGEGMVVKPLGFVVSGSRGVLQPAIKCRGPEYLRIIYGPEYDAPENIERLRCRRLGAKRALALREFALGVEGLERFVRREPLRRLHECVFGVLALESEPVDPRL